MAESPIETARLVLASASPRRQELLARLDCPFVAAPADVDEGLEPGWTPRRAVEELALRKARAVAERWPPVGRASPVVLGADTVVALGSVDDSGARILGKPVDAEEARAMLLELAGREHVVTTALALARGEAGVKTAIDVTTVTFRALGADEVRAYVATGEPLDKAGAYGIQGGAGRFVAGIDGCFFNVVGLPLARAAALLGSLCGRGARPCDCSTHPLQRGTPSCASRAAERPS